MGVKIWITDLVSAGPMGVTTNKPTLKSKVFA